MYVTKLHVQFNVGKMWMGKGKHYVNDPSKYPYKEEGMISVCGFFLTSEWK